jgi:hypothetical protein
VRSEWVSALLDKRAPIRAAVDCGADGTGTDDTRMLLGLAPAFYNVPILVSFFPS